MSTRKKMRRHWTTVPLKLQQPDKYAAASGQGHGVLGAHSSDLFTLADP